MNAVGAESLLLSGPHLYAPIECIVIAYTNANILFDFRHLQAVSHSSCIIFHFTKSRIDNLKLHSHRFEHRNREFPSTFDAQPKQQKIDTEKCFRVVKYLRWSLANVHSLRALESSRTH